MSKWPLRVPAAPVVWAPSSVLVRLPFAADFFFHRKYLCSETPNLRQASMISVLPFVSCSANAISPLVKHNFLMIQNFEQRPTRSLKAHPQLGSGFGFERMCAGCGTFAGEMRLPGDLRRGLEEGTDQLTDQVASLALGHTVPWVHHHRAK